jgi:hypothetical protein
MCCILYFLYKKCEAYLQNRASIKKEQEIKQKLHTIAEARYNARMLNEYNRNREKTYWCNY